MKNQFRILSITFLATIYCFAISVTTKSYAYSDFHNNSTSSQEVIITDFSAKLFCHTAQLESSINNFNNLPTPSFKNPLTGFWAIIKATEQLFETEFSQCTTFCINTLINLRKSDILFPFHQFL